MQQTAAELARHECLDGAVVAITRSKCRGIDLINYQTVIIVGIPDSVEEFVHIAGRVGRNGAKGSVFLLHEPQQKVLNLLQTMNNTNTLSRIHI
jgi:superfamily II DNA/RNA helicase